MRQSLVISWQGGGATPRSAAQRGGAYQQPVAFVSSGVQRDGRDADQDGDQGSDGEGQDEDGMDVQVAEGAETSGVSVDGASPGPSAKGRRRGVTVVPPRSAAVAEAEAGAAMDAEAAEVEEAAADGGSQGVEEEEEAREEGAEEQEQHAGLGLGTRAELQQREWLEAALGVRCVRVGGVRHEARCKRTGGGLGQLGLRAWLQHTCTAFLGFPWCATLDDSRARRKGHGKGGDREESVVRDGAVHGVG